LQRVNAFRKEMLQYYRMRICCFVLLAVVACMAISYATRSATSVTVAPWFLVGFALLALGLWNVSLLFGLSGAKDAVTAAAVACVWTSPSDTSSPGLARMSTQSSVSSLAARLSL
jgi:hypothetical protein